MKNVCLVVMMVFSVFVANGENTPLADVIGFTVQKQEMKTILFWAKHGQANHQGFKVQRYQEGKMWETIGFVSPATAQHEGYRFDDMNVKEGVTHYRLVQQLNDDSERYSPTVIVDRTKKSKPVGIYLDTKQNILSFGKKITGQVVIYNVLRQPVYSGELNKQSKVDISTLKNGRYSVQLSIKNGKNKTKTLVINK